MSGISFAYAPNYLIVDGKFVTRFRQSCREVYKVGPYVIKFEMEDGEESQNKNEVELYKRIKTIDIKYFPALIAHGVTADAYGAEYSWVVQERMIPKCRGITPNDKRILNRLIEKYELCDIFETDHGDLYYANWFINTKTDRPVIVDGGI